MDKREILKKIVEKKEFSELPEREVEKAFNFFDKKEYSDEEKIKNTRNFLKKIFTSFMGRKIRNPKDKDARWFLLRHISTKERYNYYEEVYSRILKGFESGSIIDLGCGINGLSYTFFNKIGKRVSYLGIDAVGQLVRVNNFFFRKNNHNAKAIHLSLFNLEKVKSSIKNQNKPRICFLFKTIDSLEMMKKDYSKKFLNEISPFFERIVISFPTKSFFKKSSFKVKRNWILNYLEKKYKILDNFEVGGERYIVFK